MDPSPEQTAAFGQAALARRLSMGHSATEVARRISALLPDVRVQRQDVQAWEAGRYAPNTPEKVEALDAVLEADGELVALLAGFSIEQRVSRLEDSMKEIQVGQLDEDEFDRYFDEHYDEWRSWRGAFRTSSICWRSAASASSTRPVRSPEIPAMRSAAGSGMRP